MSKIVEVSDIRLNEAKNVKYHHTVVIVGEDGSKVGISGGDQFILNEDGATLKEFEVAPTSDEVVAIEAARDGVSGVVDEVVYTETPTPLKD